MRGGRSQHDFFDWIEYDILTEVDPRRLQLIGAIALEWNFIEDMIDECLSNVLGLDAETKADVTSRINGLDGKFEIIKKGVGQSYVMVEQDINDVRACIGNISTLKTYRDAVIHLRLTRPNADIGWTSPKRGATDKFLATADALAILYDHLESSANELVMLLYLLEHTAHINLWYVEEHPDAPQKQRASRSYQDVLSQFHERQKRRLSLKPLPRFPDEPQAPPKSEES